MTAVRPETAMRPTAADPARAPSSRHEGVSVALSYDALVGAVRLVMGIVYFAGGLNWWVKLMAFYPSMSDFAAHAPPPGVESTLIGTGFMFHVVKATELLTGVALLANRLVPTMLVVVFPVTVSVFLVDVFVWRMTISYFNGFGALAMNGFLLLAYFSAYAPLLAFRRAQDPLRGASVAHAGGIGPIWLNSPARQVTMPILGLIALALGLIMLGLEALMMFRQLFGH